MRIQIVAFLLTLILTCLAPIFPSYGQKGGSVDLDKKIKEAVQELKRLNKLRQAADKLGNSRVIRCGRKTISIPIISDGKHLMTITVRKTQIASVYFLPDQAVENSKSKHRQVPRVHFTFETKKIATDSLTTSKQNYIPILKCLDQ